MRPDRQTSWTVPEGYALVDSVRMLRTGARDPTWVFTRDEVAHATLTPDGPATLHLLSRPGVVHARAWGPGSDVALARLPDLLGGRDDPSGFDPAHPRLRTLWRRHQGIRLPVALSLHDVVVRTILQQRVTWRQAATSWRRLCEVYGDPAPGPLGLRTGPLPDRVAEAGHADLHPLGVEQRRANLVREVMKRHARVDALSDLPAAEARARLRAIRGIGPWTEAMVAGNALADADAVPVEDYNLASSVAWLLEGRERADDAWMIEALEPYRPHRWRVVLLLLMSNHRAPRRGPGLASGWAPDA